MLRVSSQGLGLPLVVIRVLRKARLLSQDVITQHVRAVWSTSATPTLNHDLRLTKDETHGEERKRNVQATRCADEQENIDCMLSATFPGSALSNRRLQDMASINT